MCLGLASFQMLQLKSVPAIPPHLQSLISLQNLPLTELTFVAVRRGAEDHEGLSRRDGLTEAYSRGCGKASLLTAVCPTKAWLVITLHLMAYDSFFWRLLSPLSDSAGRRGLACCIAGSITSV